MELEVVWDGRHHNADRDLFNPPPYAEKREPPLRALPPSRPVLERRGMTWEAAAMALLPATSQELQDGLQCSREKVKEILYRLSEKGLIIRPGLRAPRGGRYRRKGDPGAGEIPSQS